MKFVVTDRAPATLGRKGDIVDLTKSQAVYARLKGEVVPRVEQAKSVKRRKRR